MSHHLDPLTFPIRGLRLIEASAGTGKTYTIGSLYVRLVLKHGGENGFHRPLAPSEILVVTFTNAATEELRERIRGKLVEAAAFFRGEWDGDRFLENLGEGFPRNAWSHKARMLDRAALNMDEAAIHTIHSWSNRMLRQHAFECGFPFDPELAPDDHKILEEAACDYWRCHLYGLPPQQLTELLALIKCSTPQALLVGIGPLLKMDPNMDLTLEEDPFEMLERRCQAISKARREWAIDFDAAIRQVTEAKSQKRLNGRKYPGGSLEIWADQLSNWVNEKGPLPDAKALHRFSWAGLKEGTNKGNTPPVHSAYHAFDRLNETLNRLEIDRAFFVHAAGEIRRRYQRQKDRQGLVDFDDLLNRLNEALQQKGNHGLAQIIADQFPVAMVDEFQDTDPVQYTVFKRIYNNRPKTALLMIGDPKQAIYAFRGADIHTYLRARGDTNNKPYTLGANYRATEALVSSVNRMFGSASSYPEGPFLFKDQIPFEPVASKGPKGRLVINGQSASGLHIWQLQQSEPVVKTGPHGYLDKMAEAFAHEMVRLLNLAGQRPSRAGLQDAFGEPLRPLRPTDMAVLVRSGNEADIIRQALVKRRLRSVYLSDKTSVFDSWEARQMLHLIRACASPGQERVLRAALASPILGLPLSHLEALNRSETAWEKNVERFTRYHSMWQRRGILPMLRKLLQDFGVPSGLLKAPGGERAATNFLHLAELLQTKSLEMDGPQGLIRWLEEQLQEHAIESAEQVLRLESDEDLIKVITIHKAKGLQYPLVFLPFICAYGRTTRKNFTKVRDDQPSVRSMKTPDTADIEAADRERLAEDLRLLYVAVTRAQYACWMGVGVVGRTTSKGENSTLHLSGFGYLLSAGEMIPTRELLQRLRALKGHCPHMTIRPLPEPKSDHYIGEEKATILMPALSFNTPVRRDWRITSYSGILKEPDISASQRWDGEETKTAFDFPGSALEDQLQEPGEAFVSYAEAPYHKPSIHNFPRGPEPGTFLHGLLEWAAHEGFEKVAHDPRLIHDRVETRCRHRGWRHWVDAVTGWFQDLLKTPFRLPDGRCRVCLADLPPSSYEPELEFLFAAHRFNTRQLDQALTLAVLPGFKRPPLQELHVNGMLKGFIDLVFTFEGRYYVLDYKSNHLGDNAAAYGSTAMAQAMLAHRYDLQCVLYTLALHRLLKWRLPEYHYRRDMGGAVYLFLRGVDENHNGVYGDKPPQALIEEIDRRFSRGGETR